MTRIALRCYSGLNQAVIESFLCHQLFMRAGLGDISFVHYEDQIRIPDRRQAVCNDERRSAVHHLPEGALDVLFCPDIDGARRLVQDQHGRVQKHCPRDRKELLLSGRQIAPVPESIVS